MAEKTILTSELQHTRMLETPMHSLILRLSGPFVLSQLIMIIYNTADTWFVSQISTSASAAVGVSFSMMAMIQAFGYGVGIGAASIVSRQLGAKKDSEAEATVSCAVCMSAAVGLLLMLFGLCFLRPLLYLMGATETILPHAVAYSRFVLIGAPFICLSYLLNSLLRAEGEPGIGTIGMLIGGALNVALDPIFIFTMGLGAGGAAIATAVSQLISTCVLFFSLQSRRSILHFRWASVRFDGGLYRNIFLTGFPTTCRLGLSSIATAWLNFVTRPYGDAAIAAITIANKIYTLFRHVIVGIGQCLQTVSGYNYGAGNKRRVREAFWSACLIGTAAGTIFAIVVACFPAAVISWFRSDSEVIGIGTAALRFICVTIPFMAYSTNVSQMFQSLGFKKPATLLACCRHGICFVPIVLLIPRLFGMTGLEITQPLSDMLTFVISVPFQIFCFRKYLPTKAEHIGSGIV